MTARASLHPGRPLPCLCARLAARLRALAARGLALAAAALAAPLLGLGVPAAHAHGGAILPPPPPIPDPPKPGVPHMPPPPPTAPPPVPITPPEKAKPPGLPTTPPPLPTTPRGALPPSTTPNATQPPAGPRAPDEGPVTPRTRPWLARRPPGATAGASDASAWQSWWALAQGALLPDREEARRRAQQTQVTPLANVGPSGVGGVDGLDRHREALAQSAAVPLLRRLAGPGERQDDVRASALIALGRLSTASGSVDVLLAALYEPRAAEMVRESAALGLGLLRRTRADQRATPCDLERVRDALLYAIDDERTPDRTRAFAAFALGLLGDQPAGGEGAPEPLGAVPALWSRLARPHASRELPVALLTALGTQTITALPDGVRDGLRSIVVGRTTLGRRWSDVERSHALTALARLEPSVAASDVLRTLGRHREAPEVVRAAAIALGAHAERWSPDRRAEALPVLGRAIDDARDPFTRGLLRVALGRLLAADLAQEGAGPASLAVSSAPRRLLQEAQNAVAGERGFAVLALALGARPLARAGDTPAWVQEARALLLEGLERTSEDDGLRAAYAVALGLLGDARSAAPLIEVVADRDAGVAVRGHGAVALGQLGANAPEVVRALVLMLAERRHEGLRAQAALGLSWLGTREALPLLLREAQDPAQPEHVLAQVAVALGRLGSLGAVAALAELATDEARGETSRALAVVALGLVLDPEPRSSLLRLAHDANYPSRSAALHELLTIL